MIIPGQSRAVAPAKPSNASKIKLRQISVHRRQHISVGVFDGLAADYSAA
jgi:hypothetical protein